MSENNCKKPVVFVDTGEDATAFFLEASGCEVVRKRLEVSDFVIAGDIGVERKKAEDFTRSILDGRLFEQLVNLKNSFSRPLLVIEGSPRATGLLHENTIRGALASIALDYKVPIVWTDNEEETAAFLALAARREQEEAKPFGITAKRKPFSTAQAQVFIASALPGVGLQTAKRLLNKFGSVERVFRATEKQLQTVDKIGPEKARKIRQIVSAKYEEKK